MPNVSIGSWKSSIARALLITFISSLTLFPGVVLGWLWAQHGVLAAAALFATYLVSLPLTRYLMGYFLNDSSILTESTSQTSTSTSQTNTGTRCLFTWRRPTEGNGSHDWERWGS